MKTNKTPTVQVTDEKEFKMLVHARCNCSLCMAEKNRIKQKIGEKRFYKVYEQIKQSFAY